MKIEKILNININEKRTIIYRGHHQLLQQQKPSTGQRKGKKNY